VLTKKLTLRLRRQRYNKKHRILRLIMKKQRRQRFLQTTHQPVASQKSPRMTRPQVKSPVLSLQYISPSSKSILRKMSIMRMPRPHHEEALVVRLIMKVKQKTSRWKRRGSKR